MLGDDIRRGLDQVFVDRLWRISMWPFTAMLWERERLAQSVQDGMVSGNVSFSSQGRGVRRGLADICLGGWCSSSHLGEGCILCCLVEFGESIFFGGVRFWGVVCVNQAYLGQNKDVIYSDEVRPSGQKESRDQKI